MPSTPESSAAVRPKAEKSTRSMLILHLPRDKAPELLDNRSLPLIVLLLILSHRPDSQILPMIERYRHVPTAGIPIHNQPSRLFQNHPPGTHIPRPTPPLPIQIYRPARDRTDIERGAAKTPATVDHCSPFL